MDMWILSAALAAAAFAQDGSLRDYLQRIADEHLARRRGDVAVIRFKTEYDARKARLRAVALRLIGGLDDPRAPLNPRVTGKLERDGYVVEKIIFESRPRFYVTANLYLPTGRPGPFPAVLHPVGHSTTAKNRAFYQQLSVGLVRQGIAVLIYDPIGQGERHIFWDEELGGSKLGGTTQEHSMIGWQSLLAGESVARYRIWDGMRALDYLQSRPEVDGARLGVTGCSGGGTLTTYIAALDPRIKAAAPACYISSWEEQLPGTGPQDAEQQFPDQLLAGLNHADWIGLAAPMPYLIVSTDQDFFPLEGARRTFNEMKQIYQLYDAPGKLEWFHEPGGHGWPQASREAIYTWMKQWLRGEPGAVKEAPFEPEPEELLNASATGQIGGETASSWNIQRFRDRAPQRPMTRAEVLAEITRLTRFQHQTGALEIRRLEDGKLTYRSAQGLTISGVLRSPASGHQGKTMLYLNSKGPADFQRFAGKGYTVLALDLSHGRGARIPWMALMAGRPLVGIRMNDIIRAVDVLAELKLLPEGGVEAYSYGNIGTALLHAAVADERIRSVTVEENLVSYQAVAGAAIHRDIEGIVVPGVLGRYDIQDLTAAILPRAVNVLRPVAPNGRVLVTR